MIKIEKLEEGYRTYSNNGFMIKPTFDRLGQPINPNAIYDEAEDIEVNGHPRFNYKETDIKIEILEEENNEEIFNENME